MLFANRAGGHGCSVHTVHGPSTRLVFTGGQKMPVLIHPSARPVNTGSGRCCQIVLRCYATGGEDVGRIPCHRTGLIQALSGRGGMRSLGRDLSAPEFTKDASSVSVCLPGRGTLPANRRRFRSDKNSDWMRLNFSTLRKRTNAGSHHPRGESRRLTNCSAEHQITFDALTVS